MCLRNSLLLDLLLSVIGINSLNILGVFPYQGKSHFFVFQPYLEELAKRGHNLTVISYFPLKEAQENYHDISLAGEAEVFEGVMPLQRSYIGMIGIAYFIAKSGTDNCKVMLKNKQVQKLWKDQQKFDVVVFEQFNSDCALGLAHVLKAPVVAINSHGLMVYHFEPFGVPFNPSYLNHLLFEGGTKPNLFQRVEVTIGYIYMVLINKYVSQRIDQNTLSEYFDDIPPLAELAKEIKFLLAYQHPVLFGSMLLPANVIQVQGYHVPKVKPLPSELQKFIEESQRGVIYISFGSMIKSSSMPKDKLESIIAALSELKQRVIWKWDEETLPGNPKNIYLSKWLPQNDILAHPNTLAFFSHSGLLGTTEALHHGVPVVSMPVFGDQPGNAANAEERGFGVVIHVRDLTKENLLEKFRTVLDPKFKANAKLISKAYHDRPRSPMDEAIYWTEYAATYPNLSFRTRAADVPLYQYLCLDVIAVISILFIIPIASIKFLFSFLCTKNRTLQSAAKKKTKKQ